MIGDGGEMGDREEKEAVQQLSRMIQEKKPDELVEQVLVKFCTRSGVSLDTCRKYYQFLVDSGEIKET